MKILIYGDSFFPSVGGVQTAINLLARGLTKPDAGTAGRKIEVTVATRTPANGMDESALPYRVVRRPGFRQMLRLIREADLVHVAGPCLMPMLISRLIGKPFVIEHHGYQAICPNGLLFEQPSQTLCPGYFEKREFQKCLRCCSETMGAAGGFRWVLLTFPRRFLSKQAAVNLMITDHLSMRLKLPRSRTVYYGIPEADPAPAAAAHDPSNSIEIASVGRLVTEKGLPVLLNAAKLLKDKGTAFRLTFIGDGPERSRLEQLTRDQGLGDRVSFTGDLRGSALDQAVSKMNVVVMPSVWEETAGLSAIEQMMRGRVVIAADIGGLSEVVGNAGLKFRPGDSEALASCIQQLVDTPALEVSLGAAARARAMQLFFQQGMIRGHIEVYEEVLA